MTEKLAYHEWVAKLDQKPLPSLAQDRPRRMAERAEGVTTNGKRYIDNTCIG
jgi:hypothetical protein